jgi:hypothetical protein
MWHRRVATLFGVLLLALVGCSSSDGTVHGTVTANGQHVEEGFISFIPSDGQNSTYGAPIQEGKYNAKVKPGKYWVMVSGGARAKAYPKSQEELKTTSDKDLNLENQIPSEAKGNNREVEITAGRQELSFTLEYPVTRK